MTRGTWNGRTAIITGADSPIGVAVSYALSTAGASVVLAANGQGVAKLAAELVAAGGHAVAVPTDVTNPVSVRRLVEQTLGAFGRLDAAFNDGPVNAVAWAVQYQVPPMRRTGTGSIVNLAHGRDTQAVIDLTRAAAQESGVRIDAVTPGPHDHADIIAEAIVDRLHPGFRVSAARDRSDG